MASMRVSSGTSSTSISPSTGAADSYAFTSSSVSVALAQVPTQSVWYMVWPVAGRTWAATRHRSSVVGT
jgi:hypothetical protein